MFWISLAGFVSFFRLGQLDGSNNDIEFLQWVLDHATEAAAGKPKLPMFHGMCAAAGLAKIANSRGDREEAGVRYRQAVALGDDLPASERKTTILSESDGSKTTVQRELIEMPDSICNMSRDNNAAMAGSSRGAGPNSSEKIFCGSGRPRLR